MVSGGRYWMLHWTSGLCSELQYGETPPTEAWPAQQWYVQQFKEEWLTIDYSPLHFMFNNSQYVSVLVQILILIHENLYL